MFELITINRTRPETAAFASYVSLTVRKSTDPLLVAEIWDYLCDVLMIIATRCLEECCVDYDELILLTEADIHSATVAEAKIQRAATVTEKICAALEVLVKRCDLNVGMLFRRVYRSGRAISLNYFSSPSAFTAELALDYQSS